MIVHHLTKINSKKALFQKFNKIFICKITYLQVIDFLFKYNNYFQDNKMNIKNKMYKI